MYSLILKIQLKRIWIIYLIVSTIFIAGFLFVPYIFMLNIFNLFFFAIMAGAALALSRWSLPKIYIIHLPIGINKYCTGIHFTSLLLTILPTLLLALCFVSGIKGLIMEKIYGYELFDCFKFLQVKMLLLGLLFQITVLQVIYFLTNTYEHNWTMRVSKMKSLALYAILNSYGIGFFILALLSFSETSFLFPFLTVILILCMLLPYIDPLKREILQDVHITGGTFEPDRKKLFLYSSAWGLVILCVIILIISGVSKFAFALNAISGFYFVIPALALFYVFFFADVFIKARGAGYSVLKSLMFGLCASIFPPLIPFIYFYRLKNITRLKILMDKYYKKYGPIQSGQVIDYKEIFKSQKKMIFIGIFLGFFFWIFIVNNAGKYDRNKNLIRVESNPAGLNLEFYTDKNNETVSIITPSEIDDKISTRSVKVNGYKLIEERRNILPQKIIFYFLSDTEIESLRNTLKDMKTAGKNRREIIEKMSQDKLFTMIRFFCGEPSIVNAKSNMARVSEIYFTCGEYENILESMLDSYTARLSETEASKLLWKLKHEDTFPGNLVNFRPDFSERYALKLYQYIFERFPKLKRNYENEITECSYQFIGLGNTWKNFLFEAFAKYPDNILTQVAFMNVSTPFQWSINERSIYWKYLFLNRKNSKDYNFIVEAAIRESRSMASYYNPLKFIATSASPLALEEIRKQLPVFMKKKEFSPDELYCAIVKFYPPETAFDFLTNIDYAPDTRDRALCFLKTGKVTDYFMKRTDEILKDKTLLARIGASQNEYLFPVLENLSKEEKNFTEKITSAVCLFDGTLTEKWVDYIRKEGDGKAKDFLEKTLKENASCFQMKHGTQN